MPSAPRIRAQSFTSRPLINCQSAKVVLALLNKFLTHNVVIRRHANFLSPVVAFCASALVFVVLVATINLRPAVSLYIDNREPFVEQAQTDGLKWVRIEVTRTASGEATCFSYIDQLSREGDNGFILKPDEHRRLTADDGGDPGLDNGFHIGGGAKRFFNIATTTADAKTMTISSKSFNDFIATPLTAGTYHAKIEVSGIDCGPAYAAVTIKYGGGLNISVLPPTSSWWF